MPALLDAPAEENIFGDLIPKDIIGGENGAPAQQIVGGQFSEVPKAEINTPTDYGAFADLIPAGGNPAGAQDFGLFQDLVPRSPTSETEKAVAATPVMSEFDKSFLAAEKGVSNLSGIPFHASMNALRSLSAGAGKYIFEGLQGFEQNRAKMLANPPSELTAPQGDEIVLPDGSVMSQEQHNQLEQRYHDAAVAQIPDAKAQADYFKQIAQNADTSQYIDPALAKTIPARIAHAAGSAGVMALESLIPYAGIPLMVYHGALATEAEAKNAGKTDAEAEAAGVRSAIGLALFGGASKVAALGVSQLLPEGASTVTKFLSQFLGQEVANETSSRAIDAWGAASDAPDGKKIEAALNALKDTTLEQSTLNTVYALAHASKAAERAPVRPEAAPEPSVPLKAAEIPPATAGESIEQAPMAEVLKPGGAPTAKTPSAPERTTLQGQAQVPIEHLRKSIDITNGESPVRQLPVRDPSENVSEVLKANTEHPAGVTYEAISVDDINSGGVSNNPTETARVNKLMEQMNGADGHIARIIVDHNNDVIEGQHRFEALSKLGAATIPVVKIHGAEDYIPDIASVKKALNGAGLTRSDQVNQMLSHLGEVLMDEKGDVRELANYDAPKGHEKAWNAAVKEITRQAPSVQDAPLANTQGELPPKAVSQEPIGVADAIAEIQRRNAPAPSLGEHGVSRAARESAGELDVMSAGHNSAEAHVERGNKLISAGVIPDEIVQDAITRNAWSSDAVDAAIAKDADLTEKARSARRAADADPSKEAAALEAEKAAQTWEDTAIRPIRGQFHETGMALQSARNLDTGDYIDYSKTFVDKNGRTPDVKEEAVLQKATRKIRELNAADARDLHQLDRAAGKPKKTLDPKRLREELAALKEKMLADCLL